MDMAKDIKCPSCGHAFDVEDVLAADIEAKLQKKYLVKQEQERQLLDSERRKLEESLLQFEEKKRKENEMFMQKLQQERDKIQVEVREQLAKTVATEYENRIKMLEETNTSAETKLKEARQKELDFLKKEQQLKDKEQELEISLQKKLIQEREELSRKIQQQENERMNQKEKEFQMKLQEMQLQLEQQKKLAEEMQRKAEQSSMQRQGEAQEILLEKILRENFPFDLIEEVGKGVEGADCIQVVRNGMGQDCGRIIYESKRTKGWSNNWLEKLRSDMRSQNADIAILVTETYPRGMTCFGEREGIWICSFDEVSSVACVIRSGVIRVFEVQKQQENKGDKMQMLYDYLTGNEFRGQVEAIAEGFLAMRNSITKERIQMEKIWKEREKQLEKVLISTSGLYGSVKGIAGASVSNIPLLEGSMDEGDQS